MDTPSVQIPQFSYDPGKIPDIGSGYAAGITAAGKGLSEGITSALNVMNRSQAAHDTLDAMMQNKILSPEAYASVKGKSLTAQEGLIGMYANQWIQQQAQQRALQQIGYTGAVDVQKQTAMIEEYQRRGFLPPSVDIRKQPAGTGGTGSTGGTGNVTSAAAPPLGAAPVPVMQNTGTVAATGTAQAPSPLGSGDIYSPLSLAATPTSLARPVPVPSRPVQSAGITVGTTGGTRPVLQPQVRYDAQGNPVIGKVMGANEPPPPNAPITHIRGPKGDLIPGFVLPDGTFRPRPGTKI